MSDIGEALRDKQRFLSAMFEEQATSDEFLRN